MFQIQEDDLESLTSQALRAAEQGRWDAVRACYQRRAEIFASIDPSPSIAKRLHGLDCLIYEKVRLVKGSLAHILTHLAATRQRVEKFTQGHEEPGREVGHLDRLV